MKLIEIQYITNYIRTNIVQSSASFRWPFYHNCDTGMLRLRKPSRTWSAAMRAADRRQISLQRVEFQLSPDEHPNVSILQRYCSNGIPVKIAGAHDTGYCPPSLTSSRSILSGLVYVVSVSPLHTWGLRKEYENTSVGISQQTMTQYRFCLRIVNHVFLRLGSW